MAKKRRRKSKKSISPIIITVIVTAVVVILGQRLVHKCDDCGRLFFGTGYEPFKSSQEIICVDCAEKQHKVEMLVGKDLSEFKRPLF